MNNLSSAFLNWTFVLDLDCLITNTMFKHKFALETLWYTFNDFYIFCNYISLHVDIKRDEFTKMFEIVKNGCLYCVVNIHTGPGKL